MAIIKKKLSNNGKKNLSRIQKDLLLKLHDIDDSDINYQDIPEIDDTMWDSVTVLKHNKKVPVTLRIDRNILDFFKTHTPQGKGYQTYISSVLESYVQYQSNRKLKKSGILRDNTTKKSG